MEEAGAGNVGDRRPNLLPGVNHVHAERIDRITSEMGGKKKKKEREILMSGVQNSSAVSTYIL